jgi:hypothetical protein
VTTQLRLVEPPEPRPRPSRGTAAAASTGARGGARGSSRAGSRATAARRARAASTRSGRRSTSWGDWRLDAGTRRVGRAGVARARAALEAVVEADFEQGLRAS